ncbi:hypothetical protein HGO97_012905 [Faecalicatena sp. AGMB00832]|uniref:Uncharacterized protein n=1 Tax=Faecalicatena faecalis TaxID=2726362 RepID=A0ABS6D584_9FIRM|nr:hypothetical protein [Faecalicatena faecalis]MBU3876705.1 hypothetical protein [Faecalicatena faecalis]
MMKKIQIAGAMVLVFTLLIMGVHFFFSPLSDMIVRIDGLMMLVGVAAVSYSTIRLKKE